MVQVIIVVGLLVSLASGVWVLASETINILWKPLDSDPQVRFLGRYAPILTWLKYRRFATRKFQPEGWLKIRARLLSLAELAIVAAWALWVGRTFLVLDSSRWLYNDWGLNVQSYFNWDLLGKCGVCVLWNGSFNGGAPLFIDLIASMSHPVVILLVLLFGAVNGSKLIAVAGLIMAGLAQWWLAKEIRLGLVARLWSAMLAVVGGHLIGRMQAGLSEMVFSIASVMLIIPPAIRLARTGERRMAVITGVFLGLAILSGQGYMQITLALGIVPAFLILLADRRFRLRAVWKEFVLAGFIASLIAAVLLIPVLHVSAQITKEGNTPEYSGTQPIEYQPLNLVINDYTYYNDESLQKIPWPSQTVNYIGWIPILFVFLAVRMIPRSGHRLLGFFSASIGLIYLLSSALVFKLLFHLAPGPLKSLTTLARFPTLIASLAVPFLLIIAAWGLDLLLREPWWPRLTLSLTSDAAISLSLAWLLIVPLVLSVKSVYAFVKPWTDTYGVPADAEFEAIVLNIKPSTVQWVEPPLGDWGFQITALENGIKLTNAIHNWQLKDKPAPPPYLQVTRGEVDSSNPNYAGPVKYMNLLSFPDNLYAFVDSEGQKIPCQATSFGGNIDVTCTSVAAGQLIVYENSMPGWNVKRDGAKVKLGAGQWLTTPAPAGEHHYQFRFRPWDVPLGGSLSLLGIGLSIWLWFRRPKEPAKPETVDPQAKQ